MNSPTKLLIDLSYSQQGNTGIQQELRNIFFLLAKDKRIDLSSFFYSIGSYIKEFSSFENKENLDSASKVLLWEFHLHNLERVHHNNKSHNHR
jgi:hypothetical protein